VFLNDKDVLATSPLHPPDWFGRFRESSFASIGCERHCRALMLWDFGIHDNPPMLSTIRRQLALDDLDPVSRHRSGSVAPAIANVSQHGGNLLVRKTAGVVKGTAMFPPDRVQEAGRAPTSSRPPI
jgi:hypothetical protein